MRYYEIRIENDDGSAYATYTSYANGATDPNALHIELDIVTATYATPVGGSHVRIWGVPIEVVGQARDFNGKRIKVFGGMQRGLPLATQAAESGQSGLLTEGSIIQAFGNWMGTDMSVEFIIIADTGTRDDPRNIRLEWASGAPLGGALQSCLETAFEGREVVVDISDRLVQPRDEPAVYQTLAQFAVWLKQKTKALIGGDYPGVDLFTSGGAIRAYDGTTTGTAKEIKFFDLMGQPTWIEPLTVQVSTVMRADIVVGDFIRLPRTQFTTTPQSQSQYRNSSIFAGEYVARQVRHVGAYRQPDGAAWVTVIDAYPAEPDQVLVAGVA